MPTEETTNDATKEATKEAKNTAAGVADKVHEMGNAAARKFDRQREKVANMADDVSNYVHDRNASDMMSDFGDVVKSNPVPSIIIAAVAGFFVGYTLASND
jgi:ElaB/YqjD/DUF883 family membrane-anchored ribosome-binding protein